MNGSDFGGPNSTSNGTDGAAWPDSNQFELPWWHQLAWTVLFVPMIMVATGGNLIVIWIVMTNKRMRNVTNYFLVNLSIADAMVSTLNVSVNFSYMLTSNWTFGTAYCKISQFVAVLSICASVFTLMAISIDRYIAIIHPLRPRLGRKTTLMIATSIWVVGTILSIPNLIFFTTHTEEFPNGDQRVICYAEWPDGITTNSFQEYVYNVSFMIITYFIPIGLMGFTYAMIGHELWGSQSIGECTQRQLEHIKSKRRVVKMMIVVVTIFAICWLPYHIYFIVTSHMPELTNAPYIQDVYLAFYWLAMSNSMHNPIVYCWMNSRFRQGFKQFFSFVPCINVRTGSLIRREVVTSRYSYSGSPDAHYRIVRNGTVCIPLNHLCADTGRGHLKVPTAHWRQAKKHGIDSSVGEMSSTSFSNTATVAGESIAITSTPTYNKNSSINCGEGSQRTGLGKNASSAS